MEAASSCILLSVLGSPQSGETQERFLLLFLLRGAGQVRRERYRLRFAHVSVPMRAWCSQGVPSTASQWYNCASLDVGSGAAPDSLAVPAARSRDPTGRLPLRGQMSLTNRSVAFVSGGVGRGNNPKIIIIIVLIHRISGIAVTFSLFKSEMTALKCCGGAGGGAERHVASSLAAQEATKGSTCN